MYKWLTNKYPEIRRFITKDSDMIVDNLYLDCNAIVHPCCNKELDNMDKTRKELYGNLISYIGLEYTNKVMSCAFDQSVVQKKYH